MVELDEQRKMIMYRDLWDKPAQRRQQGQGRQQEQQGQQEQQAPAEGSGDTADTSAGPHEQLEEQQQQQEQQQEQQAEQQAAPPAGDSLWQQVAAAKGHGMLQVFMQHLYKKVEGEHVMWCALALAAAAAALLLCSLLLCTAYMRKLVTWCLML